MMIRCLILSIVAAFAVGCDPRQGADFVGEVGWAAAKEFDGQLIHIVAAVEAGDWTRAKELTSRTDFETAVNEFQNAAVPPGLKGIGNQRVEAMEKAKAAIGKARTGSPDEFRETFGEFFDAYREFCLGLGDFGKDIGT